MGLTEVVEQSAQPIPHRPYSRIRGKRERSVTEIIGLKSIGGLPWAAAKETAMFAVLHQDQWMDLAPDEAVDRLRTHHRGVWDSRACIGTATHAVMEAWFKDETVDLKELVADLAANERTAKTWVGHEDEITARLVPYVDGLEKWWNDFTPTGGTAEDCVRTPGVFIGQRDRWGVQMDGSTWGLDLKTTAEQDGAKGLYADSWSLQLAAYARASEIVTYGWDEKGKLTEISTRPNEPVDRTGIIHLRGDGEYALYEVPVTDRAFESFLSLASVAQWLHSIEKDVPVALHREVAA